VGLIGWMAGRYYVKEAERMRTAVCSIPIAMRKPVVLHLVSRMRQTTDSEALGPSVLNLTVRRVFSEATRERQMAVAHGASTITDTAWCAPALVETWAGARLGAIQRRISRKAFDRVDAAMFDLIMQTLSPQELAHAIAENERPLRCS